MSPVRFQITPFTAVHTVSTEAFYVAFDGITNKVVPIDVAQRVIRVYCRAIKYE